jgi:hypothetical protein
LRENDEDMFLTSFSRKMLVNKKGENDTLCFESRFFLPKMYFLLNLQVRVP